MKWLTELFPRQYLVYVLYFFLLFLKPGSFCPSLESFVLANTQEQANLYWSAGLSALCKYFIIHSDQRKKEQALNHRISELQLPKVIRSCWSLPIVQSCSFLML